MEALATTSTIYAPVEKFMQHLMTLSSDELVAFYCETCVERMGVHEEQRPGTPFHEKTGTCCLCNRAGDVSNPSINIFLNQNNWRLDPQATNLFDDSPVSIIRDWLIPARYFSFHRTEVQHGEPDSLTWLKFGRYMAKNVYRSTLTEEAKQMLLTFYPLCYSVTRFSPTADDQPKDKAEAQLTATTTDDTDRQQNDYQSPGAVNDCATLTTSVVTSKGPTLRGVQAFVSRMKTYWKGI